MLHLFILVHGLEMFPYAGPSSLQYLAANIQESLKDEGIVHVVQCNKHSFTHSKTHDGVEIGGKRIAQEVRSVVLNRRDHFDKISFIGFSLGGLYSRYAIAELYDAKDNSICGLKPIHFVTLASPHLGVRNLFPMESLARHAIRFVAGRTGQQLFMQDDECLVEAMTKDGALPFMAALASFENRTVYANVCADFQVPLHPRRSARRPSPHRRALRRCATPPPPSLRALFRATTGPFHRTLPSPTC